ncbi:S49 family peptidase [Caulobacter sp. ErkDOM-E]|uniref:S49 family peptidase n=1 Tax=Caulobacter sp. ErkDOM-E TaxID=3402778 RepID=UPI003AF7E335
MSAGEAGSRASAQIGAARVSGTVAIVPLIGMILPRASWAGTGLDQFLSRLREAADDQSVDSIVILADSPGGLVDRVQEAADAVFAVRAKKKIVAVSDTRMASACYWICSGAHEVVASPSSMTGCVGVMRICMSYAEMFAKDGIAASVFVSRPSKGWNNPYEAMPEEAKAFNQAQVDETDTAFIDAIARNRRMDANAVREIPALGRSLSADAALAAGLVDRIATLDEVIAGLAGRGSTRGVSRSARMAFAGV